MESREEDLEIIIVPGYKTRIILVIFYGVLKIFRRILPLFKKILYFCSENDININVIWTI